MNKGQKGWFKKYIKAILESLFLSTVAAFSFAFIITNAKLKSLKLGTYPEMPKIEIEQLYQAAYPSVMLNGVLLFFAIMIPMAIIHLIIRFKHYYEINLIKELIGLMKQKQK